MYLMFFNVAIFIATCLSFFFHFAQFIHNSHRFSILTKIYEYAIQKKSKNSSRITHRTQIDTETRLSPFMFCQWDGNFFICLASFVCVKEFLFCHYDFYYLPFGKCKLGILNIVCRWRMRPHVTVVRKQIAAMA